MISETSKKMIKKNANNLKMNAKKVIFLLIMFKMCIGFTQGLPPKKRLVIDVGHGGYDSGAVGINSIEEKAVVLNIAKEIIRLNKSILNSTYDIYLTRYQDRFISLSDRTKLARALSADLFVSLHGNKARSNARGMEVYFPQIGEDRSQSLIKESIGLGLSILENSHKKLNIEKRAIKFANFQVLRETIPLCPAILVEVAFISNRDEAFYLSKQSNTKAIALAILMGIYSFYYTGL